VHFQCYEKGCRQQQVMVLRDVPNVYCLYASQLDLFDEQWQLQASIMSGCFILVQHLVHGDCLR
jgi:hypothetical protein